MISGIVCLSMLLATYAVVDCPYVPVVSHYNEQITASPRQPPRRAQETRSMQILERHVKERFASLSDKEPLETDPAMRMTAEMLAGIFRLDDDETSLAGASDVVRFVLFLHGVTDSLCFPVMAHVERNEEVLDVLDGIVDSRLLSMGLNRFGLAWDAKTGTLAAVFSKRLVRLSPFPTKARPGTSHLLWGSLNRGSSDPVVFMSTPDGSTVQMQPRVSGDIFWSQVYFPEESGEYVLEILVEEDGPQVAALFPVYVGVEAPGRPVTRLYPDAAPGASEDELAAGLLRLVNWEREQRSLPKLKWDPVLASGAREHSKAMAAARRMTHEKLSDKEVGGGFRENISMSTSLSTAHANLMGSPSHRRNILSRDVTHVGIGVVRSEWMEGGELLYLTQRFIRK